MDLWATSIIINRGHRIRVIVSGANYPLFDVNMHTGQYLDLQPDELEDALKNGLNEYIKKPDLAPDARAANLTMSLSADRPSAILLPVVAK